MRAFIVLCLLLSSSATVAETDDFATKRDAYYQSKNWGEAKFDEQNESDTVMDDIEAMFSVHGVSREQLRFIPDEHGGAVAGELIVYDTDLQTGKTEKIDCTRFGSGAYSIPSLVEHLTFETKAKFVLAIETGGIERGVLAEDDGRIVGTLGSFDLDMTVPGGSVPCAGTTWVSVAPSHRRRGVLRRMMEAHLSEAVEHGDIIAALWASDSAIYQRFGYGRAVESV